jgi:uncharacterized protein (DUF2461 family)
MHEFQGWPADATAFLAEITADNTAEFWGEHRQRHGTSVHGPMAALAAVLEPEFGPVRVFRPFANRRFRPDAPPYRTTTGGVARSAGGCTLAVVLSARELTASAGHWSFDSGQLRRFRSAVDGAAGQWLASLVGSLDGSLDGAGLGLDPGRPLVGAPRGFRADHPLIALLRHRGLQVTASWPAGEWLGTREPLSRVRAAWRAAAPVVAWLDEHVGAPESVPSRPRPAQAPVQPATANLGAPS